VLRRGRQALALPDEGPPEYPTPPGNVPVGFFVLLNMQGSQTLPALISISTLIICVRIIYRRTRAMQDDPVVRKTISYLVHEVARLFRRRFEDEARAHGLTLTQWKVIAQLQRQPDITQVALAGCIDSDPMTMSGVLDRLEKRGLILREPDPNDSRAKLARLTPEGLALYSTAKAVGVRMYEAALAGLSEEERAALTDALDHIRSNLNDMPAGPAEKDASR